MIFFSASFNFMDVSIDFCNDRMCITLRLTIGIKI